MPSGAGQGKRAGRAAGAGATLTAHANTAVARKLKIQFLDENEAPSDVPVVRVHPVPDPADPGHSLYAELCKVRVQAIYESSGAPDPTARGWVVLTEAKNESSEEAFPRSYNRTNLRPAATVLTDYLDPRSIRWEARDYRLEPLDAEGETRVLDLWSLAAPRKDNLNQQMRTWVAKLVAKPSRSTGLRGLMESAVKEVPQWEDKGSFQITEGTGGALSVGFQEGQNQLPDWLDAAFWNRIAEMRRSSDQLVRNVAEAVDGVTSDPSGGFSKAWAFVYWGTQYVRFNVKKIDSDLVRLDQASTRQVYHGLGIASPRFLSSAVAHEARHCWQHSVPDSDGDRLPGSVPYPAATYLLDSPSSLRPVGNNTEFDFLGDDADDGVDDDGRAVIREAVERDAVRWEGRSSGATVDSGLGCAYQVFDPETMTQLSGSVYELRDPAPAGQVVPSAVAVEAMATDQWWDRDRDSHSWWVNGVLVQATVETVAAPGTTEPGVAGARIIDPRSNTPEASALATTGAAGVVFFSVVPASGMNVFSFTLRGLNKEGDGAAGNADVCGSSGTTTIFVRVRGV